jgi:hypothetical protein
LETELDAAALLQDNDKENNNQYGITSSSSSSSSSDLTPQGLRRKQVVALSRKLLSVESKWKQAELALRKAGEEALALKRTNDILKNQKETMNQPAK